MYFKPYGPYLLLCDFGRRPVFPARHVLVNPYGGGFRIEKPSERWRMDRYPAQFEHELVIDPVGLNPDTLPVKIVRLLKDKLKDGRRWNCGEYQPTVVFLCDPIDLSEVHLALLERLKKIPFREGADIRYWFPEMGIEGFHDTFNRRLPILAVDEVKQESARVLRELRTSTKTGDWATANRLNEYLSSLIGYAQLQASTSREAAT